MKGIGVHNIRIPEIRKLIAINIFKLLNKNHYNKGDPILLLSLGQHAPVDTCTHIQKANIDTGGFPIPLREPEHTS